jgi:hypothetical protein
MEIEKPPEAKFKTQFERGKTTSFTSTLMDFLDFEIDLRMFKNRVSAEKEL